MDVPIEALKGVSVPDLLCSSMEEFDQVARELEATNVRMFAPKQPRFDEWAILIRNAMSRIAVIQHRINHRIKQNADSRNTGGVGVGRNVAYRSDDGDGNGDRE